MLVNQHPQLSLSNMIISGGFLNGQGIAPPDRNIQTLLTASHCLFISHSYLHRSEKPDKGHRQQSPAMDSEKAVTYRLAIVSYFSNFLVKSRCFRCRRTDTYQKALLYGHLSCPHPYLYGNKVSNQPTTYWATSPVNQAFQSQSIFRTSIYFNYFIKQIDRIFFQSIGKHN